MTENSKDRFIGENKGENKEPEILTAPRVEIEQTPNAARYIEQFVREMRTRSLIVDENCIRKAVKNLSESNATPEWEVTKLDDNTVLVLSADRQEEQDLDGAYRTYPIGELRITLGAKLEPLYDGDDINDLTLDCNKLVKNVQFNGHGDYVKMFFWLSSHLGDFPKKPKLDVCKSMSFLEFNPTTGVISRIKEIIKDPQEAEEEATRIRALNNNILGIAENRQREEFDKILGDNN